MNIKVLYLAKTGSGKTCSYCPVPTLGIKGLNPKNTAIINVMGKQLPFPRWKEVYNKNLRNFYVTSKRINICAYLDKFRENPNIKNVVIDDFQYSLSLPFIDKIRPQAGENWGDKYNESLQDVKEVFVKAGTLREDQIVFILSHVEEYGDGGEFGSFNMRMKAIGKSTHNNLTPEGMFENVLYGEKIEDEDNVKMVIRVKGRVNDTCKTVPGLFKTETIHIPNDLSIVEEKIRKYYGI